MPILNIPPQPAVPFFPDPPTKKVDLPALPRLPAVLCDPVIGFLKAWPLDEETRYSLVAELCPGREGEVKPSSWLSKVAGAISGIDVVPGTWSERLVQNQAEVDAFYAKYPQYKRPAVAPSEDVVVDQNGTPVVIPSAVPHLVPPPEEYIQEPSQVAGALIDASKYYADLPWWKKLTYGSFEAFWRAYQDATRDYSQYVDQPPEVVAAFLAGGATATPSPQFLNGDRVITPRSPPQNETIDTGTWEPTYRYWRYNTFEHPGTYWQESLLRPA